MGRWAQRRVRSSVGPGPTRAVPIVEVQTPGGTIADIVFASPVAAVVGAASGVFTINGDAAVAVASQVSPTIVRITMGVGHGADSTWVMSSQPAWITTALAVPATGDTV